MEEQASKNPFTNRENIFMEIEIQDSPKKKLTPSGRGGEGAFKKSQRVVSLDVFRGFTVALMIFVDHLGGILPVISHSPWNGVNLADFVVPFFLFIVGVAIALMYKRLPNKCVATKAALLRTLKLIILGLILQGGYFHGINDLTYGVDFKRIRFMGTLQRIAIAYIFTALCEIWFKGDREVDSELSLLVKYQFHWIAGFVITVIYLSLLYGLYVPDWEYQIPSGGSSSSSSSSVTKTFLVKCGVRGDTGPACNAVGMIDRKILGINHLYIRPTFARTKQCSVKSPRYGPLPPDAPPWCQAPFDPEGLLGSIMAIVTCLIGLHYGHVIVHFRGHKERILNWTIPAVSLLVIGIVLDCLGIHGNKNLYSFSYMCNTTSAAGVLFIAFYAPVDVFGYRWPTKGLEWMGKHALMIYILLGCNLLPTLLQGFYWENPQNNFLRLIGIKT
ncbi:heparan-alpha-glucosaminide N-acetyltransferase-like [Macadamia integrifolia]|uniref:heparan-alpha-glucosaminide N-acetyltransferase-like n=1 Tax=Macadamia integrifolia TaxID=60698 RepID=UPI001C4FD148|nr:heparan-alpha-glucosaminide N-acetyltransferase-like [Macadamia integrifolia]XP_042502363.1 heparan-alpha-glucosaminide N-acetyltransferase-like [Macadamia integrifolia]